jgi:hypothetical protein
LYSTWLTFLAFALNTLLGGLPAPINVARLIAVAAVNLAAFFLDSTLGPLTRAIGRVTPLGQKVRELNVNPRGMDGVIESMPIGYTLLVLKRS